MLVDSPVEHFSNEAVWFGSWRNVALQFWHSSASLADIEVASRLVIEQHKRMAEGVVCLSLLRADGVPKLGDAERQRATQQMSQLASALRMGVQVIENDGFMGALLRSVVSGINRFSKSPTRVFAHMDEATRFLLDQKFVRASASELNEAVAFGRERWDRGVGR